MRCFLAVPIPGDVREAVLDLVLRLRPRLRHARFVSPEALHLTLHFFEDLDDVQVAGVREAAREGCEAVPAFAAALSGLGVFPDPRRPRVLWIGATLGADGLHALHAAVARGLRDRSLPVEDRPFKAHLTLARFREPEPGVAEALSLSGTVSPPAFEVREAVLFRSVLAPTGAVHTVLDRFPLARVALPI